MQPATAMLGPVLALVLWTLFMQVWMYATRLPAIRAANMRLSRDRPRGEQMAELPPHVRWKADNYNHLLEQPTLFYAVALALAVLGDASLLSLALAWAYVATRIVHSLQHVLVNYIPVRFMIFSIGSLILLGLAARAVLAIW